VPGDYAIVPSGLSSANYSINYTSGTLTITTTNQAPMLDTVADAVVLPGQLLTFNLQASDPNGDATVLSLDPGAPAGAIVTTLVGTNTIFRWRPTRAQASSTNVITVRVTDNGGPSMTTTRTFTVIVLDYLELGLASTNLQSGQTVAVPITLASSEGVTNLDFNITWPNSYLANAALSAISPAVGSANLQDTGTNLLISIQTAPGQVLQGTQQIAQLSFTAISNEYSAFVSLPFTDVSATKPDGSSYTNYITSTARIAVIEGQPLLWASLSANSARELTLYGRLGVSYELQYSTNLAVPGAWDLALSYVQTNGAMTISADSGNPNIFYRIFQP
jgi:MBG domain (YGX type)